MIRKMIKESWDKAHRNHWKINNF